MNKELLDVPFRVLLITVSATRSALYITTEMWINPLNAELNRICHLLALLGARHILHVSRIRVNSITVWFRLFAEHWPRQRRRQNLPPDIYLWLVHSVIHTSPFNPPILWAATGLRKAEVGALKHMHAEVLRKGSYTRERPGCDCETYYLRQSLRLPHKIVQSFLVTNSLHWKCARLVCGRKN